ncbi:glycosyltransferase family 2 protein [Actinomycetospora sp. CA-101289]|uniref:glycosyltransferase family 2 protein n=1 Tax=Actinomycetospora sp. CA-101289 TaxID=3239893 RepID=UPI003D99664E
MAFVVATLNEERSVEHCVRSLLTQDYRDGAIEVVVVDGGSTDRTRSIVSSLTAEDPRVRLVSNPGRIAASAFNLGIEHTTAELISLVSGHGSADPDYARTLVETFTSTGAALVGGRMVAEADPADGPMAQAIARAMGSPLGQGPSYQHYGERAGWVDTAFPGAYRRDLIDEIGGFDEALVRNQDDELHLRARLAGYPMWFEPRLRSRYRPRADLRSLWSQYHQYGWWRWATLRKHGRVASFRHLIPAALVAGLAGGPALAVAVPRSRLVAGAWAGGALSWLALLVVAGWAERDHGTHVAARVPVAMGCLHLAYGAGFWRAVAGRGC